MKILIIFSFDQNISLIFYVKDGSHIRLWHPSLCLHYRSETVHCSTKDPCTSEISSLHYNLGPLWVMYTYTAFDPLQTVWIEVDRLEVRGRWRLVPRNPNLKQIIVPEPISSFSSKYRNPPTKSDKSTNTVVQEARTWIELILSSLLSLWRWLILFLTYTLILRAINHSPHLYSYYKCD